MLECILNGNVIVVLLSHDEGGIHLSWLPLPDEEDVKDLAAQITMRRRYLTNQIIAIVGDEDTGERDIAEPPRGGGRRRTTQQGQGQGQQRRTAAAPVGRGAAPAGNRQQTPAGAEQLANRTNALLAKLPKGIADDLRTRYTDPNELLRRTTEELNASAEQLANRTNALLAKLPKEVADDLRKRHTDPNELLRRTIEELNRRNGARSGGADKNAAAGDAGTAQPADGQPGNQQAPAQDADDREAPPPANPQVEKHINDGMRALKLSPDKQTALRKQFQGDPNGLLRHIKALYNARKNDKEAP